MTTETDPRTNEEIEARIKDVLENPEKWKAKWDKAARLANPNMTEEQLAHQKAFAEKQFGI
jgi:hypothetical protein